MKIITRNIILFTFIMLTGMIGYAGGTAPPKPTLNGAAGGPPGDPDGPIDENIAALALSGLLLGAHTVYRQNKKRPI